MDRQRWNFFNRNMKSGAIPGWMGMQGNSPASGENVRLDVRTDMADEARDMAGGRPGSEALVSGVRSQTQDTANATITRVQILTDEAERIIGKKKGTYITIESEKLRYRDKAAQKEVAQILSAELSNMISQLGVGVNDTILIAGLGNWNATPDAIGPLVVGKVLVTRHLYMMTPPEKRGGLRSVAALSPGVLGITGIETAEIIHGVVQKVNPKLVIAIDALASRNMHRIGTSIQIGNTGINPGSGVGNRRFGIDQESLGVPVIAIGVPTVVDAITIASDVMDILDQKSREDAGEKGDQGASAQPMQGPHQPQQQQPQPQMQAHQMQPQQYQPQHQQPQQPQGLQAQQPFQPMGAQGQGGPNGGERISPEQRQELLRQVLAPYVGDLIVTPKEIDSIVEEMATVVASGINGAVHPNIDNEELYQYLT